MKKLLLITSMLWLFVFAWCTSSSVDTTTGTTWTIVPEPTTTWYTIQDVEAHATPDSCRSIVRNQVYDFTARSSQHPGWADKIIAICGKDATPVFEKVHGGKEKPEMKLPDFLIGELK